VPQVMRNHVSRTSSRGAGIDQLVVRSGSLECDLETLFGLQSLDQSPRAVASRQMCSISFEHGRSVRLLVAEGNLTSAFGLLRLQYEALVRGEWLRHAASDDDATRMHRDLHQEAVERFPMAAEMLKSLQDVAPPGVMATLNDFAGKSLKSLNSYVHSGEHAYQRSRVGYPESLVKQMLIASNGLQWVTAFEVASHASDANAVVRLYGLRTTYADCLPVPAG